MTIRAAVHSDASLRLDAGTMRSIVLADYAGPGDLVVVGRSDERASDVHLGLGPASGCKTITIEPGAKVTISGPGFPPAVKEIVVNGTLELAAAATPGIVMQEGQILSGTGTVRIVGAAAAQSEIKSAGKDLKIVTAAR